MHDNDDELLSASALTTSADRPCPRTLYIDLLIRSLTNTIYADPSMDPWTGNQFDERLRAEGRDWPAQAMTMIGVRRLQNVRRLCERVLEDGIEGDLIETGIWRGGACILMRGILAAHGDSGRKVYCADSFQGLPTPKPEQWPADAGDKHHEFKELAISLDEVTENFRKFGLLDDQVVFLKGWFSETLPTLTGKRFSLLRLDGDMYESTMVALRCLYDGLSPGGFVIVDDYSSIENCRQAVDDFRTERGITVPMHEADWTAVWWRKPE